MRRNYVEKPRWIANATHFAMSKSLYIALCNLFVVSVSYIALTYRMSHLVGMTMLSMS